MIIDFELIDNAFSYYVSSKKDRNELEKAREIREQFRESIDWLSYMLSRKEKTPEYEEIQKEIKSALRQYENLNKKIENAELRIS